MQCKQNKAQEQIKKLKNHLGKAKNSNLLTTPLNLECCQKIIKKYAPIRERIYTPFQVICSFIKQVLNSDKSCSNAVISVAAERIKKGNTLSINTGPYVKARQRMPKEIVYDLVRAVGKETLKTAAVTWKLFGREVKLCDGTNVQMPDTKANNKAFPKHNNKKKKVGFPLIRIVAVMSLTTGSVIDYAIGACKGKGTGEISLFRKILGSIEANDIVLSDRLYFNFFLTHDLLIKNADIIVPGHTQRCYDFRKGLRLNKKDHIVAWIKPKKPQWMTQPQYEKYPKEILIREFKVGGVIYITTLLDEKKYHKKELASAYKNRWQIETNLNNIKTTMGMDKLSCKSPDMIEKEIGIHFLAYNIIRNMMVIACIQYNALPNQVSFKGTIQLLNEFTPYLLASSRKRESLRLSNEFLRLLVTKKVGNRPGRCEPRAVKSKPKTFKNLKESRKVAQIKLQKKANKIIKLIEKEALAA